MTSSIQQLILKLFNFRRRSLLETHLDPKWYLARYPDLAEAGVNPRKHFKRNGQYEGRLPSALAEDFDREWYLRHYKDVADLGIDPLEHYLEFGLADGRSPNGSVGLRFNATWYAARNADLGMYAANPLGHFLTAGKTEGRSPNPEEESREYWHQHLDINWYLTRNPDAPQTRDALIEHYINIGIPERRRPNKHLKIESRPVLAANIECTKAEFLGQEVAIFVTHAINGIIKPHITPYLRSIKQSGISTVLIVSSDQPVTLLPSAVYDAVSMIYRRANEGFDFSAWAHVLQICAGLYNSNIIYLLNDSVLGPIRESDFVKAIGQVRGSSATMIGMTSNLEHGWHIQSYFLALKKPILTSRFFQKMVNNVVSYYHKAHVINEYETQFARVVRSAGFTCEVLFASPDERNPTLFHWKALLNQGFPFLKLGALWAANDGVEINHSGWRELASAEGYDSRIVDRTLAQLVAVSPMPIPMVESQKLDRYREYLSELHNFFADEDWLELPHSPNPILSIIIVLHNKAELTLRYLKYITILSQLSIEVIVVNNNSHDDTQYLISKTNNIIAIENHENIHPLLAANQGSLAARGRTLLFLTNDTWVEAAAIVCGLEALDSAADIGAVLVPASDALQESLGVGLQGGGRHPGPPSEARRNYDYDVESGKSDCLIITRELFEEIGRFNTENASAYDAKNDLCRKIRDQGFRVVSNPSITGLSPSSAAPRA